MSTQILEYTFAISGCIIFILLLAKLWEDKRKKPVLLLSLISKGDTRARNLSHEIAHYYSDNKTRAEFFLNKQLPMQTKNFIMKTNALVKDKFEEYVGDVRGSRFLKKNEGISEFFQALEEKEEGRIDETLDTVDTTQ